VDDLADAADLYADVFAQPVLADAQRLDVLFQQYLAGMDWRQFL
jgi:hypothetical protein